MKLGSPKPVRIPVHTPVTNENPRSGILVAFGVIAICSVLMTLVFVALGHYILTLLQHQNAVP